MYLLQLAEEKKMAHDNTESLEMEVSSTKKRLVQSEGIFISSKAAHCQFIKTIN